MISQRSEGDDFCEKIIKYTAVSSIILGVLLFNFQYSYFNDRFYFSSLLDTRIFNTTILFVLVGISFLLLKKPYRYPFAYWIFVYITFLISFSSSIYNFSKLWILSKTSNIPNIFFDRFESTELNHVPVNYFIVISIGLIFAKSRFQKLKTLSQYAFYTAFLVSFFLVLKYLFDLPQSYKYALNQMDLLLILMSLSIGVAGCLVNKDTSIVDLFLGKKIGHSMFRRIFPATVIIVIFQGFGRVFLFKLDFITIEFGITISAVAFLTIAFFILRSTAQHLNIIDDKRLTAECALKELNISLELKIIERTNDSKISTLKFYKAFQMSPAGMFISDINTGIIMEVNNKFLTLTKYRTSEIVAHSIAQLKLISMFKLLKLYYELKLNGNISNRQIDYQDKNKLLRTCLLSAEVIEIYNIKYAITTIYDITNRIEIEKQLITNTTNKVQIITDLSHEIRTPMNAIIGLAGLIEKNKLSKKNQEYLSFIKSSGANLIYLINNILDYSKIEAGKMLIEATPFKLVDLLKSMELMFKLQISEKNLTFHIELDDKIPSVLIGDPTRLTQILTNLIANSVKFTKIGNISILVKLNRYFEEVNEISFMIKDTGIGIDLKKQQDIFKPYVQATVETNREYGGSGLGLSIVKNLINIQNGTIHLNSTLGKGTQIELIIPFKITQQNFEIMEEEEEQNLALNIFPEELIQILVFEDNLINQYLTKIFLKKLAFEVTIAANGQIGIDKLINNHFDLILMDLQMPVMDGYTATKIIRSQLNQNIPIIAMSASSAPGEKEMCIALGMNDYILKPFAKEEFIKKIYEHVVKPDGPISSTMFGKVEVR